MLEGRSTRALSETLILTLTSGRTAAASSRFCSSAVERPCSRLSRVSSAACCLPTAFAACAARSSSRRSSSSPYASAAACGAATQDLMMCAVPVHCCGPQMHCRQRGHQQVWLPNLLYAVSHMIKRLAQHSGHRLGMSRGLRTRKHGSGASQRRQ